MSHSVTCIQRDINVPLCCFPALWVVLSQLCRPLPILVDTARRPVSERKLDDMASAILFDSGNDNINSPHSSDDSDAVNTDSARVYFGPLQSPEKKFAPPPGSARLRTPLRRSTRLSSAAVASSILSDKHSDGEEDAQSEPNAGLPYQPKESSSANDAIVLGGESVNRCSEACNVK